MKKIRILAVVFGLFPFALSAPLALPTSETLSPPWQFETRGSRGTWKLSGSNVVLSSPSDRDFAALSYEVPLKNRTRHRVGVTVSGTPNPGVWSRGAQLAIVLDTREGRELELIFPLVADSNTRTQSFDFDSLPLAAQAARIEVRLAWRAGQCILQRLTLEETGNAMDPAPSPQELSLVGGRAAALRASWNLLLEASRRIDKALFLRMHTMALQQGERLLSNQRSDGAWPDSHNLFVSIGENTRLLALLSALPETPETRRPTLVLGARKGLLFLASNQTPEGRIFPENPLDELLAMQAAAEAFAWIEPSLDDAQRSVFLGMIARGAHHHRETFSIDRGGCAYGQRFAGAFPILDTTYAALLAASGRLLGRDTWINAAYAQHEAMNARCQEGTGAWSLAEGLGQVPRFQDETLRMGMRLLALTQNPAVQKSVFAAAGWIDAYALPGGLCELGQAGLLPSPSFSPTGIPLPSAGASSSTTLISVAAFLASIGDARWRKLFDERLSAAGELSAADVDALFWLPSVTQREVLPDLWFDVNPDHGGFLLRKSGFGAHVSGRTSPCATLLSAFHIPFPDGPWQFLLPGLFAEWVEPGVNSAAVHWICSPSLQKRAVMEKRLMAQHTRATLHAGSRGRTDGFPARRAGDPWLGGFQDSAWNMEQTWVFSGDLVLGYVSAECLQGGPGNFRVRLPLSLRDRVIAHSNDGANHVFRLGTLGLAFLGVEGAWKPSLTPGAEGDTWRIALPAGDYQVEVSCGDPTAPIHFPGMRVFSSNASTPYLPCAAGALTNGRMNVTHPGGDLSLCFTSPGLGSWKLVSLVISNTHGRSVRRFEAGPATLAPKSNWLRLDGAAYDAKRGFGWWRDLRHAEMDRGASYHPRTLLSCANQALELTLGSGTEPRRFQRGDRLGTFVVLGRLQGVPWVHPLLSRIKTLRTGELTALAVPDGRAWNLVAWNSGNQTTTLPLPSLLPAGSWKIQWIDSEEKSGVTSGSDPVSLPVLPTGGLRVFRAETTAEGVK